MARKVFVDMDGVVADMALGYFTRFGTPLDRVDAKDPAAMWANVNGTPNFFEELLPTPDAFDLWHGLERLGIAPIVLSGVSDKCQDAPEQKRRWVQKWLGARVPMIFCRAMDKCLFGSAGDVLIDNWTKYQAKWEAMGGIFIVHTSAEDSLRQLGAVLSPQ